MHRSSQLAHELDHEVDVLLLVLVVPHEGLWHGHVPHLSDDLGTTVPSAFALRAVIVVVQLLGSCGLFAAAVLPHEVLAWCASSASPLAVAERCSFTYHVSRLYVSSCVRSPGVCLAPRAPNSSTCAMRGLGCVKVLAVSTSCSLRPRADPRVRLRMLTHALLLSTHLRMLCVVC